MWVRFFISKWVLLSGIERLFYSFFTKPFILGKQKEIKHVSLNMSL